MASWEAAVPIATTAWDDGWPRCKWSTKHFLWQGLRMLHEEAPGQSSLHLYEPGNYAPLRERFRRQG